MSDHHLDNHVDGHQDGTAAEQLRLLALALLDHAEPGVRALLTRLEERPPAEHPPTCTWCPLCAVVGLLRGDRPELAAALGHHAEGLITALRAVLAKPAAQDEAARPEPPHVQRIEVRPAGGTDGGC